ncbi:MAG: DUF502 domain-containing protein [Myxococcales bacterium]|nr:DUF502 domain-containing protein [Myxococcales bacterium]
MNVLTNSFLKGLLIVVPLAVTIYVIYAVVAGIDSIFHIAIPGIGLLITVLGITFVGFIASNVVGRRAVRLTESALQRMPFVRFLYTSIKDLIGAFVGERRSFDQPVLVRISKDADVTVMGFLTREVFDVPGLEGKVGVYVPQSYNFAGNLLVVAPEQVTALALDSATVMALIVSGGVTGAQRPHVPQ